MNYNDMNEDQKEAFWNAVTRESAETATERVFRAREAAAERLIEEILDCIDSLGLGPVGNPTIALYAEELVRLAQLPEPKHNVPLLETPSEEAAA